MAQSFRPVKDQHSKGCALDERGCLRRGCRRVKAAGNQNSFTLDGKRCCRFNLLASRLRRDRQDKRRGNTAGFAAGAMPCALVRVLIAATGKAEHRNGTIRKRIGGKIDPIVRGSRDWLMRESDEDKRQRAQRAHSQLPIVPKFTHHIPVLRFRLTR